MIEGENILEQTAGMQEKLMTMLIWKLVGRNVTVQLSAEDIAKFNEQFPQTPEGEKEAILLVRGRLTGIEYTVMDRHQAEVFAKHFEESGQGVAFGEIRT